ncbi:uncharacterized protein A4U43_C05F34850 [Asparagus officinalis]|uniref:holo-[acyl-carrier-protein] synthase n=1 Tax=Asparagus officinalis TaxID=4686 RepID=A0A5P1EWS5_ASPOF|nr:uncharacterized protein LOC109841331 isoform X2 [Asparagus officinalis]ONK70548.1 uncharacterized protein A4U43_C05F34850 [Asparagus officinalis]
MLGLLRRNMLPIQPDILTRRFLVPTPSPPPLPLPSPRETHFWYVIPDEVKDDFLLNRYVELLSPCERRSILQMNNDKVQKGALLARALVRTTLARYTNGKAGPSSLQFRKNKFGKPEVEWKDDNWTQPSLHFNISHTSSLIACGITTEVPIGIDVEEKQRKMRNNILSFAQRYFSSCEVEFLQSFSDPESQRQEFIKIWTLKEAYVKALGRGFSAAPFRDFSIRFEKSKGQMFPTDSETAPRIVVEVSDTSESLTSNWQFALFELDGSHYAAVCVENNNDCTGSKRNPLNLKVWKTLPLVEDENVLNKNAVLNISGLS